MDANIESYIESYINGYLNFLKSNDMYVLSRSNIQNIFLEDVRAFLDTKKIKYVPNHRLIGKSGLLANYDFAVPKIEDKPMTLIKTINKLDKDKVKSVIFDWNDTRDTGNEKANLIVVYNDVENEVKEDNLEALRKYHINQIPWSIKEQLITLIN